jgi:hypothetical protein
MTDTATFEQPASGMPQANMGKKQKNLDTY